MLKKVVLVVGIMLFSLESFSQKTDTINKSKKDSVNIPKRAIAYAEIGRASCRERVYVLV